MVIFTPKKVIDGANNSEMITSSPYAWSVHGQTRLVAMHPYSIIYNVMQISMSAGKCIDAI